MWLVGVRARLPVEGEGPGCRNADLTVLPGESLLPQGCGGRPYRLRGLPPRAERGPRRPDRLQAGLRKPGPGLPVAPSARCVGRQDPGRIRLYAPVGTRRTACSRTTLPRTSPEPAKLPRHLACCGLPVCLSAPAYRVGLHGVRGVASLLKQVPCVRFHCASQPSCGGPGGLVRWSTLALTQLGAYARICRASPRRRLPLPPTALGASLPHPAGFRLPPDGPGSSIRSVPASGQARHHRLDQPDTS